MKSFSYTVGENDIDDPKICNNFCAFTLSFFPNIEISIFDFSLLLPICLLLYQLCNSNSCYISLFSSLFCMYIFLLFFGFFSLLLLIIATRALTSNLSNKERYNNVVYFEKLYFEGTNIILTDLEYVCNK